ncbi:MAG: ribbon-helix-helix protein, CopG family [bacterium]|nr:ribbon-helix-helix protein, CopG family [bacterium]
MTTQMIIRIEPELKNQLYRLARVEGKTTSQMIRELIKDYVQERDINSYIDELWSRIGKKLTAKGIKPKDLNIAIKEIRKKAK